MGSNFAECHPVGFRWVMKAKERGCKVIHIDPRFTRTSAMADLHVAIRSGSDIAFLGGLINYILTHDRWFRDYVVHYTNASTIVSEKFQDTEDLDGLFSGYDEKARKYQPLSWCYFGETNHRQLAYLHGTGEESFRRAEVCSTCHGYLKSIAVLAPLDLYQLLSTDLTTAALDAAALERGFHRT